LRRVGRWEIWIWEIEVRIKKAEVRRWRLEEMEMGEGEIEDRIKKAEVRRRRLEELEMGEKVPIEH